MQLEDVLEKLKEMGDPKAIEGMARYGINPEKTYGVSIPKLRATARQIKRDRELAGRLWASGIHEARILASMIDDAREVTAAQMEDWVKDFDSWDVCDQCIMNLFEKTGLAYDKAFTWSEREEEFIKRAGFVLMARLAVSDKKAADERFYPFLSIIVREAADSRNFVKKAVNWALRQIGKRNLALNSKALEAAREIKAMDLKGARWIAADAIRELTSVVIQQRLKAKKHAAQPG